MAEDTRDAEVPLSAAARRPNILLFMPDQLRADAVGAFGNPLVHTPNIDALAGRGIRFANAFAQNPVCSPSRCSIMTGWYPHVQGHRTLTHLLKANEPNLLRLLKDAGYNVAWAGRRGDTFASGVVEASTDFYGFDAPPRLLFEFSNEPRDDIAARTFYHGRRQGAAPCFDFDEATVATAERLIREELTEPWLLLVALIFPHPPFETESPFFELHDPDDMPAPVTKRSGPEPRYLDALRRTYRTDRASPEHWQRIVSTYYGMTSRVDAQLGRLLGVLEDEGLADNTATLFFTDHGEYLGDYGLIEKWPAGMEDCLLRNPLIIVPPGATRSGASEPRVCTGMVELVDLLPTCLEWAGVEAPHTHFGRSLLPLLDNPDSSHKDFVISEGGLGLDEAHLVEKARFPYDLKAGLQAEDVRNVGRAVAIRTREWTYVHRRYDCDELYDRENDPREIRNLIDEPAHRHTVASLRSQLLDFLVSTSDVVPWTADPRY